MNALRLNSLADPTNQNLVNNVRDFLLSKCDFEGLCESERRELVEKATLTAGKLLDEAFLKTLAEHIIAPLPPKLPVHKPNSEMAQMSQRLKQLAHGSNMAEWITLLAQDLEKAAISYRHQKK